MPSDIAIEATDLTKRYGSVTAVESLSLSVPEGTVYGFLGPNGAGKTTTMRLLTTLSEPTSGTARVAEAEITDRDAVAARIGYLPEEPPLYDELTGREQLTYVAGLRDLPGERVRERVAELAGLLDLDALDRRVEGYSSGMRRKLGFIQAVLHEPSVLFLDEPTNGLDPRAARTLRDTLDRLADEGTTVFLSTHVLPVVDEHADTVGVLADGRLVAEGPPSELKRRVEGDGAGDRTLEEVFLEVTAEDPAAADDRERAATAAEGPADG
ncbi:ABC transporter ATP-binding protein [Haloglomus salinum]|uniref:ABC transporter ATP-binding protein n=1 Tax=Haloglomus salinum TaxID=2962673 RepID=UPI0020C98037|nr:ABC transporter ATP-binding protein [Haloglomus salinum]